MPSPTHEAYRSSVLSWCRNHAKDPGVEDALESYAEAAQILWHLDLEPARPVLLRGYAKSPRGGDPWDPLVLLRCLMLAVLLRRPGINDWVPHLKASHVLLVLCGIDPDDRDRPGVATLYDFLHRLHKGAVRDCSCGCQTSPATLERRRSKAPRPKNNKPRREETKAEKRARKRKREKNPITATATVAPSATKDLVEKLMASAHHSNPEDLLERLAVLLLEVAVTPSAEKGLLGALDQLTLCGDGTALETGASPHGKRTCDCPRGERCKHDRIYSDPDAAWGWDAYRDRFFFGHHPYELTVGEMGHDLPIFLSLDPGNESDFTASLRGLDRLHKLLREHRSDWRIRFLVQDAGHDGEHNYRFPLSLGICPVIPLAKDAPATHPQRPELSLSPRGVPLCQAGIEMAPWGSAGEDRRLFACPVKAGFAPCCPLAPENHPDWRCRPEAKMAPVVNLSVEQNPRLCPPVPRNSSRFQDLYRLRSTCERSFSVKKEHFELERARHRRRSFWLIRLYLMAILQHVRAWVADKDPRDLLDHLLGRSRERAAA